MDIFEIKQAITDQKLHPLIEKRWSPRAFSSREIQADDLEKIFTAASWAPSANNEQPWSYIYATRGIPGFDSLWNCLSDGNKSWSANAPVIFVSLYRKTFKRNGKENKWALHDLGMANAQLLLQATELDIFGHLMAGFDMHKLKERLNLDDDLVPACMGVLGYLGNPDSLEEPYRTREKADRKRNNLNEFVQKL